eukprot:853610-Pelagomonas_calceolata.AAC.1
MKRNIFNYRTLFNQKHAVRFNISTSALHILSGCKHSTISNMVTERHKLASRILLKGISKGPLGAGLTSMDAASWLA